MVGNVYVYVIEHINKAKTISENIDEDQRHENEFRQQTRKGIKPIMAFIGTDFYYTKTFVDDTWKNVKELIKYTYDPEESTEEETVKISVVYLFKCKKWSTREYKNFIN